MTDVRIVESDLPPIMVGIIVHVAEGYGQCTAGIITELLVNGEARIDLFQPPGRPRAWRDQTFRFEPGGMNITTFHRLLECPALSHASTMGTWPPAPRRA